MDQRRRELLSAWLAGLGENTRRAYAADAATMSQWLGFEDPNAGMEWFFGLQAADANLTALRYAQELKERGLSGSTIGRRLASLKSLNRCARMLGCCSWAVEVNPGTADDAKDMGGPGEIGYARMRQAAEKDDSDQGVRDFALMSCLHDLGLRRSEAAGLMMDDLVVESGHEHGMEYKRIVALLVKGKGRGSKQRLTMPLSTSRTFLKWLDRRGWGPGAVFARRDKASDGSMAVPLTGESVRQIVARISKAAGLSKTCRPHGLRHESISKALDLTGGNLREVAQFSRHKNIQILVAYDDRRRDAAGRIAAMVAGD